MPLQQTSPALEQARPSASVRVHVTPVSRPGEVSPSFRLMRSRGRRTSLRDSCRRGLAMYVAPVRIGRWPLVSALLPWTLL